MPTPTDLREHANGILGSQPTMATLMYGVADVLEQLQPKPGSIVMMEPNPSLSAAMAKLGELGRRIEAQEAIQPGVQDMEKRIRDLEATRPRLVVPHDVAGQISALKGEVAQDYLEVSRYQEELGARTLALEGKLANLKLELDEIKPIVEKIANALGIES